MAIRRLCSIGLVVSIALAAVAARTEADGKFVEKTFADAAGDHGYMVYEPEGYSPDRKWPVLLFLHGAGERGTDGRKQTEVGLGPVLARHKGAFPFVVVFPQCESTQGPILSAWDADTPDGKRAVAILDRVLADYSIDPDRQCLTGWSMGAFGAVSLAEASPARWRSVVILSGGGTPRNPEALTNVPIWAFHGERDSIVYEIESTKLINSLSAENTKARLTILPGRGHNIWREVYRFDDLYRWMLNPSLHVEFVPSRFQPGERPEVAADKDAPFVPALEIPQAVYLRMGNDMLAALAGSVPSKIPEDLMTGSIDDIYQTTSAEGINFGVWFSNIRYSGKVSQAYVAGYAEDRLNIQLALSDVVVTIGRTDVSGSGRSAVAGRIDVVIGHREPVWLSIALEPYVKDRKLKLKLVATRFDIPNNNWYVTSPAGVSVRGLGMTSGRVSSGLVDGLYGSKSRFENEVKNVVPGILDQLEENLEMGQAGDFLSNFWPLPVYQPRVKLWPEQVKTDDAGVSILFGLTAAAVDADVAPETPAVYAASRLDISDVPKTNRLQLGLADDILEPLTQMLVDENRARIHLRDVPGQSFQAFFDRSRLEQAIPELKRFAPDAEIWAEFILQSPLAMENTEAPLVAPKPGQAAPTEPSGEFEFDIRSALLAFGVRNRPEDEWTSLAEFDLKLQQDAVLDVERPDFQKRELLFDWEGGVRVDADGHFVASYKPEHPNLNNAALEQLFRESWDKWVNSGPAREIDVPDIDFGETRLRLTQAGTAPHLFAEFAPPGIKLTNSSDKELTYQIRTPTSPWSASLTLPPGKSHEYDGATNFIYRTQTSQGYAMNTLPAGSHSEYRSPHAGGPEQLFLVPGK